MSFLDPQNNLKGELALPTVADTMSKTLYRCFSDHSNSSAAGRDGGGGGEVNSQFLLRFIRKQVFF